MGKEETEELIKNFVMSIKTAEKKPRLGVVECLIMDVCFFHSMLDVHLFFKNSLVWHKCNL